MPNVLLCLRGAAEAASLAAGLAARGLTVSRVATGEQALESAFASNRDFVAVETDLPGINGFEVCRVLKRDLRTAAVPVVLIGTSTGRAEILAGFEAGACEFLTRPLDPQLFAAKVEALLRHLWESLPALKLAVGPITMDTADHMVEVKGSPVRLTGKEFALLELFLRRPGKLLNSDFILGMVWGGDRRGGSHTLTVHVQRLRQKLGPGACRLLETIHGLGYRLNPK
ncbi:MAG: response regulator transcription factor [Elusimicrobia bacterium]|nr:response regulator transcription factor [Elusimicrobiota bacterium]